MWLTGPRAMAADSLRWMSEGRWGSATMMTTKEESSDRIHFRQELGFANLGREGGFGVKTQNLGQNLGFASDSSFGKDNGV